jgi:hypothetical protein
MRVLAAFGLVLSLLPAAAGAQQSNYNVQVLSFDSWCQDVRRYPAERCEARSNDDQLAFNEYRATIERYELPYLKRQQQDADLNNRVIDHEVSQKPWR